LPVLQEFCLTVLVLEGGFLPPLANSFQELTASPKIQKATDEIYLKMLQHSRVERDSTHPPLKLRLERLERLCGESEDEHSPAMDLLDDPQTLERDLAAFIFNTLKVAELPAADWESIGANVHVQAWRAQVNRHVDILASYTVGRLPDLLANLPVLTRSIADPEGTLLTREQRTGQARQLIWKSLALKLLDRGWRLEARPGTLLLIKGDQEIIPADLLQSLTCEKVNLDSWSAFCENNGLSDQYLAARDHY